MIDMDISTLTKNQQILVNKMREHVPSRFQTYCPFLHEDCMYENVGCNLPEYVDSCELRRQPRKQK